jgi:hypothetical protein
MFKESARDDDVDNKERDKHGMDEGLFQQIIGVA